MMYNVYFYIVTVGILDNILSYQQVNYDDLKSTICSPVRGYIVPHIK